MRSLTRTGAAARYSLSRSYFFWQVCDDIRPMREQTHTRSLSVFRSNNSQKPLATRHKNAKTNTYIVPLFQLKNPSATDTTRLRSARAWKNGIDKVNRRWRYRKACRPRAAGGDVGLPVLSLHPDGSRSCTGLANEHPLAKASTRVGAR